jgi:hypothetical protein
MSKRGKRSLEAKKRREQKISNYKIASILLLRYSWKDLTNGEVVFTEQKCRDGKGNVFTFKTVIENKLLQQFGYVPEHALNHECGDVLNRFTITAPLPYSYYTGRM